MAASQLPSPVTPPGDPATDAILLSSSREAIPLLVQGSTVTTSDESSQPTAAPTVDAERAFDELARAQRLRLSKGDGGGLAGAGSGGGGIGLGLSAELSGRQVTGSPVVSAPVVVEGRPVECELPPRLRLSAVVHVLVTRDGAAAVPRLLRSSGSPGFDRCALRYVLAMRFAPGLDDRSRPLDVWMNVNVAPLGANEVGSPK